MSKPSGPKERGPQFHSRNLDRVAALAVESECLAALRGDRLSDRLLRGRGILFGTTGYRNQQHHTDA